MISILSYLAIAGLGLLLAWFLSRPPELHALRLSQFIFVPAGIAGASYFLPKMGGAALGGLQNFIDYLALIAFLGLLLAPNIAYHCGVALVNLLDPYGWTPLEEELALRPIRRLIECDRNAEALAQLDQLLKEHKPTHEALLVKSKLLNHFGRIDDTVETLLQMLPLSNCTQQQLAVMDALAVLEGSHRRVQRPISPQLRRVRINHELVLFPFESVDFSVHKEIPPGDYEVSETFRGKLRWLTMAGTGWGNFEFCWEAVEEIEPRKSIWFDNRVLALMIRMHQAVTKRLGGRPNHFQKQTLARKLLKEAIPLAHENQWDRALPLLQKAFDYDPQCYEIAFRLVQASRHVSPRIADMTLREVLEQSRWTENEKDMLQSS
jgi:tetratricopeptide (TPR) repeat protein